MLIKSSLEWPTGDLIRSLNRSKLDAFRALKSSILDDFRVLKSSNLVTATTSPGVASGRCLVGVRNVSGGFLEWC